MKRGCTLFKHVLFGTQLKQMPMGDVIEKRRFGSIVILPDQTQLITNY